MTTAELSAKTLVPPHTIRRMAEQLDGVPIGGRHGYEFPNSSPALLRALLRERHKQIISKLKYEKKDKNPVFTRAECLEINQNCNAALKKLGERRRKRGAKK